METTSHADGQSWMEIIHLRTESEAAASLGREQLRELGCISGEATAEHVDVCLGSQVRSDLMVLIRHRVALGKEPDPRLGHSIAEALRDRGSVSRSLWICAG